MGGMMPCCPMAPPPIFSANGMPDSSMGPPLYAGNFMVDMERQAAADVELLCDACVALSACGVAYALQSVLENAVVTAESCAFSESVCHILLAESHQANPLDEVRVQRLAQLLDMQEYEVISWLQRCDELRRCLIAVAASGAGPPKEVFAQQDTPSVAAMTWQTFNQLRAGVPSAAAAARHFGRQTIWCAMMLLRRVFRQATGHGLQFEPDAQLAQMAVAAFTRGALGQQQHGE